MMKYRTNIMPWEDTLKSYYLISCSLQYECEGRMNMSVGSDSIGHNVGCWHDVWWQTFEKYATFLE
jgi:hypothetical protein